MSYIDGNTLDECREALRQGITLETLAGKLGCTPEHLARLLDLKPEPSASAVEPPADYLWAADRAKEVL